MYMYMYKCLYTMYIYMYNVYAVFYGFNANGRNAAATCIYMYTVCESYIIGINVHVCLAQ